MRGDSLRAGTKGVFFAVAIGGCQIIAGIDDRSSVSATVAGAGAAASVASSAGPGGAVGAGAGEGGVGAAGGGTTGGGVTTSAAGGVGTGGVGGSSATGAGGACSPAAAYRAAVLASMPSAYWRFEERPGATVASDDGPAGIVGSYIGGITLGVPGALSGETAARFDGKGGYIDFGDILGFAGTVPFSVEYWMRPTVLNAAYRGIVSKEYQDGVVGRIGWLMFLQSDPNLGFGFERWGNNGTGPGEQSGIEMPPPAINQWVHVLGTYDGAQVIVYLNGVFAKQNWSGLTLPPNSGHLIVGARYSGTTLFFAGDIDEVAIYDYALPVDAAGKHVAAAVCP